MLFVNMVVGGIIRIRKNWRTIGVVISHCSILMLLVAGAVSFYFKREGNLKLHEGQTGSLFTSYHDRVIEITEVGKDTPVLMIHERRVQRPRGWPSPARFTPPRCRSRS